MSSLSLRSGSLFTESPQHHRIHQDAEPFWQRFLIRNLQRIKEHIGTLHPRRTNRAAPLAIASACSNYRAVFTSIA